MAQETANENRYSIFTYSEWDGGLREEICDSIGNAISLLLASPKRRENRAKLKKRLKEIWQFITDTVPKEALIQDIELAVGKLEERLGQAVYITEKGLKRIRVYAVSWSLAFSAMLLDRRWRILFDTAF